MKTMTNEEIIFAMKKAKMAGEHDTVNKLGKELYLKNKGLLHRVAESYKSGKSKVEREDIDATASLTFYEATTSYDPTKGLFSTWAYNQIDYAMKEFIRKARSPISIPNKLYGMVKAYEAIEEEYRSKNNDKPPTNKYILIEMKKKYSIDEDDLKRIKAARSAKNCASFDEIMDTTGGLIDRIDLTVEIPGPDKIAEDNDERRRVRESIKSLSPNERRVVYERYYEEKTPKEIAKDMGCEEKRIYKTLEKAKNKLKNMKEIKAIEKERHRLPSE